MNLDIVRLFRPAAAIVGVSDPPRARPFGYTQGRPFTPPNRELTAEVETALLRRLSRAVMYGDPVAAERWAREAVAAGIDPLWTLEEGLIKGVKEVEDGFVCGDLFLPELVRAGEALKIATAILEIEIEKRGVSREVVATAVVGTVEGDLHDIGKGIVSALLHANGFRVIDLGYDVPGQKFVEAVAVQRPEIVGLSCLLTPSRPYVGEVIRLLIEAGLREQVLVIVGGSPITQEFADSVGADLYGIDAVDALEKLQIVMGATLQPVLN